MITHKILRTDAFVLIPNDHPSATNFLVYSFPLRTTLSLRRRLSREVGNVSLDDLLHLSLNVLGKDTTAELLEESSVLSLQLLGAAAVSCDTSCDYCQLTKIAPRW
jgi:hypothetical protein